jgi:Zn-dependent protease with chaperone function
VADAALDRDILQRIARYRRRRKARLLFLIAPVMLETVALAILPIVWSQVHGGPFFMGLQLGTRADWALWSIFMALTVLPLGFLLMAWTEKVPVAPGPAAGIDPYRDAAASLSIAAGVPAPDVVSLAVPTVNALAFSRSGKWSIGITEAALAAGLTDQQVEALTAHEAAHLLLREGLSVPDRRARSLVTLMFTVLIIGPFLLASFMFGFSWYLGLACLAWTLLYLSWALPAGRRLRRNDDVLADTVASRLTCNPAALRETIELLEDLYTSEPAPFPPGAAYPDYLFISRAQVDRRLANLAAIEREGGGGGAISGATLP